MKSRWRKTARLAVLVAWVAVGARSQISEKPLELAYGQTVRVSVTAREPSAVDLQVETDKTVRLVMQHDEPSLVIRVVDDDQREVRMLRSGYPGWILCSFSTVNHAHLRLMMSVDELVAAPVSVSASMEHGPSMATLASQMEAEKTFTLAQALRTEMTGSALQKAIRLYQSAGRLWTTGENRPGQALALMSEGETWLQLSRYREALNAYSQAKRFAEHATKLEVAILNGEARIYMDLWRDQEALQLAQQALRVSEKIHDLIGGIYALENRGEAEYYLLDRDESKNTLAQAMELARRENDRIAQARILCVEGWRERTLGRITEATKAMSKADRLFQETGDVRDSLGELFDIATTDSTSGDPYAALLTHVKLAKLFHQAGRVVEEAYSAIGIGEDYVNINRASDGLSYFRQASRIFASINNVWVRQSSLGLSCNAELTLNLLANASTDCMEVKRLAEQYGVPAYIAEADRNLGRLAEAKHQDSKALIHYQEAERLTKSLFPLGRARSLVSLGTLQEKMGDGASATHSFEQALELSKSATDTVGILETRYQLAQIKAKAGQLKEAQSQLDHAIELFESERLKVHDNDLRTSYFASASRCYELYVEILMERHRQDPSAGFDRLALEKSEAGRARTLLDALVTHNNLPQQSQQSNASPELIRLHTALNQAYEIRLNLIVRGKNDQEIQRNAADIRRLADEYDQARNIVQDQEKAFAPDVRPLTVDQLLSRSATMNSAILEYQLGDKQSFLWRIEHGELKAAVLPDRQTIAKAVQKWRDLIAARQRRASESFASFQMRVEKADRELPIQAAKLSCMLLLGVPATKDSRLVIVAGGILQSIPFAALPLDGCANTAGAPLLSAYEITNTPSINVLLQATKADHAFTGDVAILADPVFSPSDARISNRNNAASHSASLSALQSALRDVGYGTELPRLTATRKEAQSIASAVPSAKVLLAMDFKANLQTAVSEEMSQYRIWHFATHGLLDTASPELSGLVFSLVDEKGHPRPGYLKTHDIFDLSINTDLVVLSACNSGLGEQIDGEGSVGLSYAFLRAGAKQVVSTLWNVDDMASSDLMSEFYRGLLTDHLLPAAALRRAQQAMLTKRRNAEPFYWAGYVVTSN